MIIFIAGKVITAFTRTYEYFTMEGFNCPQHKPAIIKLVVIFIYYLLVNVTVYKRILLKQICYWIIKMLLWEFYIFLFCLVISKWLLADKTCNRLICAHVMIFFETLFYLLRFDQLLVNLLTGFTLIFRPKYETISKLKQYYELLLKPSLTNSQSSDNSKA